MASALFTIGGVVVNALAFCLAALILSSVGSQIMKQKNAKTRTRTQKT